MTDTTALPQPNDVALPEGEEVKALPASETPVLEASVDEVQPLSVTELEAQTQQAEEFGEVLMSLQNIVQRYGDQLDELNGKIKELRDSLNNLFANNEDLQKAEEQEKTLKNDVKQKRQRIKESPEAVQMQMKIRESQEEANEIKQSLSNNLIRYYQMTGSQVIENADGTEREFSVSARLKGKKKS